MLFPCDDGCSSVRSMGNDVLAEILDWSSKQPSWQRDALRRLFTAGSLSSDDADELLEICKALHGLAKPKAAMFLEKEHLAIKEGDGKPVSLVSLTHHRGVNALALEQTVAFGPSLTIVYGQNAAGKSGYTRILKSACRSRSTEDILGNVLADGAPLKGQATIAYRDGTGDQKASWTPEAAPTGALASVSVFDGQCAPVYLRDKTDVAFRPFSLDVFDKLSGACSELKKRLEGEQLALYGATAKMPAVGDGTKVAALLLNLTSLTKPDAVRTLATLSDKEEARLKALRDQRRDLLASDPKKAAQALDLKAGRFDTIANHVARLVTLLNDAGIDALRTAASTLKASRAAMAQLRKTVMTPDLLPGTGEEMWRALWDAAEEFSSTAYPELEFPVVSADTKCVLCQQPIGKDSATRFKHFVELVTSTAQADVRSAEDAHRTVLDSSKNATIERNDIALALAELTEDDPVLAKQVRSLLDDATRVRADIVAAKPLPARGVTGNPEADVRTASKTLRERASQLRKQTPQMDPKEATELKELEARETLKQNLQTVLDEIERKSRIAAYTQCIEDTSTAQITRKSTELTKRLVTERLRDGFQKELTLLEFTHLAVEIKAAGATKGALFHRLIFSNAPGIVVATVLSEGESRTLSLAAFLAELATAPSLSGIIFDDPVSSLDHIWRERIGRRLALEAKARQVIVFTHDLLFLKVLLDECAHQEVAFRHQYVRRDDTSSGICSADLPWVAMRVKERLGVLRARWQETEKLSRTTPTRSSRSPRCAAGSVRRRASPPTSSERERSAAGPGRSSWWPCR